MFQFFANIFGFILNLINNWVGNYGLAIILFTLIMKLLMLPLSIKQQKTLKKNNELQEKMKVLQFKYKNDPESLNMEVMKLYKDEKMSPFSGCFTAIAQFILLISIFYMVRCPLTYMKKIDNDHLQNYVQQMKDDGMTVSQAYYEIDIIREVNYLKEKNPDDENLQKINFNMNFIGIDLGKIPQQNLNDWTVYIIPILYILSTFVSMRINTNMQKDNKKDENEVIDVTNDDINDKIENDNDESNEVNQEKALIKEKDDKDDMAEAMEQSNKMMAWMMPIMSVSISLVAPLGLALYWLMNNVLMICERLILNKLIKD